MFLGRCCISFPLLRMQLIVPVPAGTALFHYLTFKLSPSFFFHLLPPHFVTGPFIFLIIIIVIIISSSKSQLNERSATLSFSPLHRWTLPERRARTTGQCENYASCRRSKNPPTIIIAVVVGTKMWNGFFLYIFF